MLANSAFGRALNSKTLALPPSEPLPGTTSPSVPYVIVGDEAFPLKENMMRPYPGRGLPEAQCVYNYRLSRARRVIENSFGILAARWRVFCRPLIANPENVVSYTKAAIALHNFLRTTEVQVYCPPGYVDGEDGGRNFIEGAWRREELASGLEPLRNVGSNHHSLSASAVRDAFKNYFTSSAGEVSWQYQHVRRTS